MKKNRLLFLIVIVVIAIIYFSSKDTPKSEQPTSKQYKSNNTKAKVIEEAKLEVLNWNWKKEYDYLVVEGYLKNISNKKLENVCVVANFFDNQDNFITSVFDVIDYNPLMSDQKSPFKTFTSYNPRIKKVEIEFKNISGLKIKHKYK